MSPHLRGSIRPATSEPHLPGFGSHQRSQSPLGRHPRAALQTNIPPPPIAAFGGGGGGGGQQPQPSSFYDDGSCLSVAKQLSETRLGAFPASANEAVAAAVAAASGGGGGPAGGAAVASTTGPPPTHQQLEAGSMGGTSGRSHSPLARQFPISSAYEPFIRSLSPHAHLQQQSQQTDHLRVTGASRRGRSVSPDIHGRMMLHQQQQHPQHFSGGGGSGGPSIVAGGFEQQFPPPNVVRGRMQADSQGTASQPHHSRSGGPPHHLHHPHQPPAIMRLTRQNSCSDTQLNVTIGGNGNEQGRIHGIRCVLARIDSNFGQKGLFCMVSTPV